MDIRLEIVSGKGGVGKSAVTAAIALHAARAGRRVLALATTDARGLGAHLGRQSIGHEPSEVRDDLYLEAVVPGPALQQYLKVQIGVPTPRMSLATRAFDLLATAAPGIREVITIGKVVWEAERGGWDMVVVDAPPTGQLSSYLTAPNTVAELVPTGKVKEQSAWMRESLASPATRLTLVTTLEELPVTETREALQEFDEVCGRSRVLANRVLGPLDASAKEMDALADGATKDAALMHEQLRTEQTEWFESLTIAGTLSHQFGVLTPPEVAAHLADELT